MKKVISFIIFIYASSLFAQADIETLTTKKGKLLADKHGRAIVHHKHNKKSSKRKAIK